ncbi:MAG: Hsp20 family protein [Gammaproteobacteria bacterium]
MRNLDFAPLYRSTVGFDHLTNLLDAVNRTDSSNAGYPPYNIELLEKDNYRITMAVAGFTADELEIQAEQQTLTVKGKHADDEGDRNFLHQGIAARNFERRFQLADHIEVTGARIENGLLHIDLVREIPEAMKPKKIAIGNGSNKLIDVSKEGSNEESKEDSAVAA